MMNNGVMFQYFEWNLPDDGSLWVRIKEDVPHLYEIGISAVWIPPAYKAAEINNPGYAAYDLYDLGEFDQKGAIRTKYGTKEELQEMITELHRYNISVYLDAVLNHKIGADKTEIFDAVEVDALNRNKDISEPYKIEGWTNFEFDGRHNQYSSFKWHSYHFTGLEIEEEDKGKVLYRITGENKHWSKDVDTENGNFDYLMGTDIDHSHPEVIEDLNRWGVWVSKELHLDGIRLDAIKHISRHFIHQFAENLKADIDPDFYLVGEYWKDDLNTLLTYLEDVEDTVDLFDVPLHFNFKKAASEGASYDLRQLFDNTLIQAAPTQAVTFVDNHDSQKGGSLESEIDAWFKPLAYAVILLRKEGYPCLFYGDYYGIAGEASPYRAILDILLDARKRYAYGEELLYMEQAHVIAFVRLGDDNHPGSGLVVVLSNTDNHSCLLYLGERRAGQKWKEITGAINDIVEVGEEGNAVFNVNEQNLSVWVQAE